MGWGKGGGSRVNTLERVARASDQYHIISCPDYTRPISPIAGVVLTARSSPRPHRVIDRGGVNHDHDTKNTIIP